MFNVLIMMSENEVHVSDVNSEFYGVTTQKLMENAGRGVFHFIIKNLKPKGKNIIIFCGKGNNGGDGFVAARYLSKKYNVTVFLMGKSKDIHTKIAKNNFKKLKDLPIEIFDIDNLDKTNELIQKNNVIIDSMLGVGIKGELREPFKSVVKKINKSKNKTIISVDIPTGLATKLSIKPEYTITFHDIKENMNKKNSGKIKIVDIKIPKKAVQYVGPGELSTFYPKPNKESHKGENGKVLIIGGGPFIGAPALSGLSALRTGADLVYILTPKTPAKAITSFSPRLIKPKRLSEDIAKLSTNLIVGELNDERKITPKDLKIIKDFFEKTDCLVIGPGLGTDSLTKKAVKKIIKDFKKKKKPMVIDADAIEAVGEDIDLSLIHI